MKNQAGPAQDPWPPPAKPVRPRTLGPPSQAGPAQDPWPPKPSRSGPGPLAPQAKPVRPRTLGPIELPIEFTWKDSVIQMKSYD